MLAPIIVSTYNMSFIAIRKYQKFDLKVPLYHIADCSPIYIIFTPVQLNIHYVLQRCKFSRAPSINDMNEQ